MSDKAAPVRDHLSLLTPESLTAMLRSSPHLEGARDLVVAKVASEPVGMGQMATSLRLTLEYAGEPVSAPRSVVAKVPSEDPASLAMAAATGGYEREVLFYRDLAPALGDAVPLCHHGSVDESGTDFVLLLEDLAPATMVDQRAGGSVDQLAAVLERAADLHGTFWGRADSSWLPVEHVWGALAGQIPAITDPWLDRFGSFLDAEQVGVIRELGQAAPSWVATLRQPRTVWHGDLRLDNILFDARDGATAAVLVDWQSAASGPGVTDLAYAIGTTLEAEVRQAHERDLVAEYHGRLTSHEQVSGYPFDACWLDYRAQALYALVLTVPVSMGVQSTERGDAMFGAMASRAAGHVLELDTAAALATLSR